MTWIRIDMDIFAMEITTMQITITKNNLELVWLLFGVPSWSSFLICWTVVVCFLVRSDLLPGLFYGF
jgi:hypothetical protein